MINDRREHARQTIDPAIFVRMNEKQGGLLFDLSEGGLALDVLTPKSRTAPINLNFQLPSTLSKIEAHARMVWVDRWNHRIGVRFIDLPETSRLQLREWLSASAISHTGHWQKETPAPAPEPRLRVVPATLTDSAVNSKAENSVPDVDPKPRRLDGLFWGLLFLSSTLFLLAFLMSRSQQPSQAQQFIPEVAPSTASSGQVPAPSAPAPSPELTPQLTPQSTPVSKPSATKLSSAPAAGPVSKNWQLPHQPSSAGNFVLQVGAMRVESNAVQMSAELAKKNFQCFVIKRPGDPLFRVNVGPYSDAASAHAVQLQLESQGITAILKSQPPQ